MLVKNILSTLFCLLLLLSTESLAFERTSKIAIIIDDIGYRKSDAQALALPGDITYSVLPHTPYGKKLALQAYEDKHDIMLHIPMEAENGKKLGPGALTTQMTEQAIRASLTRSFDEIPFAIGINNHMGSKLTKLYSPMAWTMRFLKERDVLFLDSLTTQRSQAENVANHYGVTALHRHIFLDNELSDEYISKQFMQMVRHAKKHKTAIAIAHPHPQTIETLSRLIPTLAKENIELVSLSSLAIRNKEEPSVSLTTE